MSEKRKISVRKILQATVTVLVTGACVTAMLSAARLQDTKKIKGLHINIKNEKYGFIDKAEIKNKLLEDRKLDVNKVTLGRLDVRAMENMISTNKWVADAQVYVDNEKVVHINLTQRVPVARLFDQAGNSYYLDNSLKAMPLSDRYIHYTIVVTNVPVLHDDSAGNALKAQIVKLVKYIERDSFWTAQISQIVLTDDKTFEVVPVLGNHKILIGDTSRLDEKFDNLYAFYKKILNRIGWDKYEVLDVRYAGQIVASPALPWKAPVDKAMSNMNWVKSIIGSDTNRKVAALPMPAPAVPSPQASIAVAKPAPVVAKPKPIATQPAPQKAAVAKQVVNEVKKTATQATIKKEDKKETVKKTDNKQQPKEQNNKQQTPKYLYQ